jgi:hypothetical protein
MRTGLFILFESFSLLLSSVRFHTASDIQTVASQEGGATTTHTTGRLGNQGSKRARLSRSEKVGEGRHLTLLKMHGKMDARGLQGGLARRTEKFLCCKTSTEASSHLTFCSFLAKEATLTH